MSLFMLRSSFILAVVLYVVYLTACSISDRTSYEDGEGRIPEKFFSDIRRGKTEKSWVVSQLGEPDILQKGPDAKEIYTYRLMRAQQKHADLLVVLRYNGVSRDVEYFHLFFDNDIVRRHWRDSFSEVQTGRYFGPASKEAIEVSVKEVSEPEPPVPQTAEPAPSVQEEFPSGWTADAKRELSL